MVEPIIYRIGFGVNRYLCGQGQRALESSSLEVVAAAEQALDMLVRNRLQAATDCHTVDDQAPDPVQLRAEQERELEVPPVRRCC